MSALEQSLDAIIAQSTRPGRKPTRRNLKGSKRPAVSSKSVIQRPRAVFKNRDGRATRPTRPARVTRPIQSTRTPNLSSKQTIASTSLDVATKVVVSGLPKDIKQDVIKQFFQSQVGPVEKLTLSYNEKGRSTGVATVVFKNSTSAKKAVSRYNNAPIDFGRGNLKLELVVDTTEIPLAARIQPVQQIRGPSRNTIVNQRRQSRVAAVRGRGRDRPATRNARAPAPKKEIKKKKKTIEELDQEMADYFAKNDN